jgi:hypothetical protein
MPSITRFFSPRRQHDPDGRDTDEAGGSMMQNQEHAPAVPTTPDLSDLIDGNDDENLPEVFTDISPELLSPEQTQSHWYRLREHQYDKYPVQDDPEPVIPGRLVSDGLSEGPYGVVSPLDEGCSPWESLAGRVQPQVTNASAADEKAPALAPPPPEPKICGIKRRTFLVVLAMFMIVLIVSVCAGVGGAIAVSKAQRTSASPSATATATTTVSVSTPSATPTGTATSTTNFLTNGTAPQRGFAFQGFSGGNFTGNATGIYQQEGFYNLTEGIWSYVWLPDITGCCVTFCTNMTHATGYWCAERYRILDAEPFGRISIWCGANYTMNSTCS